MCATQHRDRLEVLLNGIWPNVTLFRHAVLVYWRFHLGLVQLLVEHGHEDSVLVLEVLVD